MSGQIEPLDEFRRKLARASGRRAWPAMIEHAQRMRSAHPDEWEPDYYEARGMIESGRYEDAEHLLLLAMDRFPRQAALPILYGESGLRRLGPAASIERWQSLRTRLPDEPNMYMGLASAYAASEQPDEATRVIEQGLLHLPGNVALLENRAQLAWTRQDWNAALLDWSAVHAAAPEHETATVFMIRALARLERTDEADALAMEEMAKRPEDVELAVSYASAAQHAGDAAESVRRWRLVHQMAPQYPFGALGLGRALAGEKAFAEADAVLAEGLRHNPDHVALLTEYAANASRAGKWDAAADRWGAVYDRCPSQTKIYIEYIKALEQAQRLDRADEIASEAVGFAPDQLGLHRRYAAVASLRGDNIEALRRWEEAARLFPDEEAAKTGLRRAQKALERDRKLVEADEEAERNRTPASSLSTAPVYSGPPRVVPAGPTALDLLMSGKAAGAMAIPTPQPTGWAALRRKFQRVFGGAG